jgi:hypothetical protein
VEAGFWCFDQPSICAPFCGDGLCIGEDPGSCPADCPSLCGNDSCEAWEDPASCPDDCFCGDGLCKGSEDFSSCPADCTCGDGVCSGVENSSSCPGDCHLVINEVDYDQPDSDIAEFIEIYNPTSTAIALEAYRVEFVNGADGTIYGTVNLPAVALAPYDFFVIGKTATVPNVDLELAGTIQNGDPDGIRIVTVSSEFVDGVAYNKVDTTGMPGTGEGAPAPGDSPVAAGSICRCPNGADTNNNAANFLFAPVPATPGTPNACP